MTENELSEDQVKALFDSCKPIWAPTPDAMVGKVWVGGPRLKPCPFCGSQNLTRYRFDIGGFLDMPGCTETICENGDTFRIECGCGCKFDKCQDELFEKAEEIYTCDGKYDVEITDMDLWNMLIVDWNRRVSE